MRGANERKTSRARRLRQVENDAESELWSDLRARRLNGFKFVRQLAIGPYFADFACREILLVVEVDGSQHVASDYDEERNSFMNLNGWSVARFWNVDVLRERYSVLETIVALCEGRIVNAVASRDFTYRPASAVSRA